MKKLTIALIAFLGISTGLFAQLDRTKAPEAGPAPEIKIGEYDLFTLDNGLKVIVVENHKIPRVSFSLSLDYKPIHEGERVGYTGLAGQLMNMGTTSRTKAQLDEEIDFIGASLSASSSGVFASSLTKHQDKLLELMTDVLFNPSFPEAELDKLKKQTISGMAAYKEDAGQIAGAVGDVIRYGKSHPYGEISLPETIEPITVDECKEFYNTYYKPNIAYLTIVGDITKDQAMPLVNKYFADWEKGEVEQKTYDTPGMTEKTKVVFVDRPQSVQSVVRVTYPLELKPGSEDAIPARVMNTILGGGFSSNLNQNLREDHGYTYGARSSLSSDRVIGSFSAGASVRNEVTDSTVYEIFNELNSIRENPVDETQLQSIKNYITGGFARGLESPQTVARFALNIERYGLDKDYYANYLKRLNAVTVEDVQAMAKKYIHPENAYILVVGKKDEVAESLQQFGEVEYYDIYGDPEGSFSIDKDPMEIIDTYIKKIGGTEKLSALKSLSMSSEASVQGMTISFETAKVYPAQSATIISMGGNVVSKQVYNKGEAIVYSQGQKVPVSDKQKMMMEKSSMIFPELEFNKEGYDLQITGIKKVSGEDCYQVKITYPDKTDITNYYSTTSGLLLKTEKAGEGESVYSDYREVEGILMPYAYMLNTPQGSFNISVKEIKLNGTISEDMFN